MIYVTEIYMIKLSSSILLLVYLINFRIPLSDKLELWKSSLLRRAQNNRTENVVEINNSLGIKHDKVM